MALVQNKYKVARNVFSIEIDSQLKSWKNLCWHYEPFLTDEAADIHLTVVKGAMATDGLNEVYTHQPEESGMMTLSVYTDAEGGYVFDMKQPTMSKSNGWLHINSTFDCATLYIDEDIKVRSMFFHESSVTSGIMLFYMLATMSRDTLMAHASSVIYDGKAYLFIAKSGTGKSTHTRLWGENIDGVVLLNDDHPILRADESGVIAYGSPWSGKTHCYKNLEAPLGAIGRIRRALSNSVQRLNPIEAYASLSTSFSGMTWNKYLADNRHRTIERVVMNVPCYYINCLPDADAALLSCKTIAG